VPIPLSFGAQWLAASAGHVGVGAARRFWRIQGDAPVLPVAIPIGREFHLVRVPVSVAERTWRHLQSAAVTVGPVLAHGHTWDFFVPTYVTDGRDVPGGCLLTGVASPQAVICPLPETRGTPSLSWIHAPDGSGSLTDPKDLAVALASQSTAHATGRGVRRRREQ
jgi:hypothetical protein